jgi:ABC-type phosphate transport system substrate-binding protein
MKFSITGATFLLVGASAVGVFAADTTGNNLVLNGSDTLFEVTSDVLSKCDGTQITAGSVTGDGLTYQGGGSGVGEAQMQNDLQEVAPMSRALGNVFCGVTLGAHGDISNAAHELMIGLDGIAVVANTNTTCTGNGISQTGNFSVTVGGDGVTPATNCPGCAAGTNTYTFANSLDPLKIVYGGRTSDGTVNCAGDVRKSLVKQWHKIFSNTSCGTTTCDSAGLTHAWRRADLSGTTDAFQGLTGLKTGNFAIGTLPLCVSGQTKGCVPAGASAKTNPFCNSADLQHAGTTADPFGSSNGGKSDYSDNDPIRVPCNAKDDVCNANGQLGLLLPVAQGDTSVVLDSDNYPTTACLPGAFELQDTTFGANVPCPGGPQFLGECFQPYRLDASNNQKYDCFTTASASAFGTDSGTDGRVWNLPMKKDDGQGHLAAYVRDANRNLMINNFFRIHLAHAASYACGQFTTQAACVAGTNCTWNATASVCVGGPTCTKPSDTEQIGCLVNADPCSIGYAGREAVPSGQTINQALLINGLPPTSANIAKLLTAPGTQYALSRRLYFASLVGFNNTVGGERQMAKCFGNNPGIEAIMAARNFVPLSPTIDPGLAGVQCLNPGAAGGPSACTNTGATNTNCTSIDIISGTP